MAWTVMTRMVWPASAVSVASMASLNGGAPRPFRHDSSVSRVVTSSRRGGSHASTRPVPSQPSDSRCRWNWARGSVDRKSTRLNSSHQIISYAVFCLKKKKKTYIYNYHTSHHHIRQLH